MYKLAVAVMATLTLLTLAYQPVRADAEGDTLQKQADAVKAALLTGTPEELYSALAPWQRGAAELRYTEIRDEMLESVKADPTAGPKIASYYAQYLHSENGYDPASMVKIADFEELLSVTPAQVFALEFGYYRLRGLQTLKERIGAKWFLVERTISDVDDTEQGRVRFANAKFHHVIEVTCVAEGSNWQVSDVRYRIGAEDRKLGDTLAELDWDPASRLGMSERRAEAEQLLGAARDMLRVEYSKSGVSPANYRSFMGEETQEFLIGEHFSVLDVITPNKAKTGAVLLAYPEQADDGAVVLEFEWATGSSWIEWCDDDPALVAAFERRTGKAAKQLAVDLAKSARDVAMAKYAKANKAPSSLIECGWVWDNFVGVFYNVGPMIENYAEGKGAITVEPTVAGLPYLILKFDYANGGADEVWNDDAGSHYDAIAALIG